MLLGTFLLLVCYFLLLIQIFFVSLQSETKLILLSMPRKKVAAKAKEIIHLREKKLSNGNVSLYLDYNKDGKREYEFLKLYLIPEKTPFDRLLNQQVLNAANAIKAERTGAILAEEAGLKRVSQSKMLLSDWIFHCAEQADKKVKDGQNHHTWGQMLRQTAAALKEYAGERVRLLDVDKEFVKGFVYWLQYGYTITRTATRGGVQNEGAHLSPKTAHKKYSCFRYVLNEAVRDGIISNNPCNLLAKTDRIKVPESTREFLTIEELKRLEATPTASEETRRVYLFMAYCGLRISDVKGLRWQDIDQQCEPWRMTIRQQKTQKPEYLPLSDKAREFLPPQGEKAPSDPVFAGLPTEPAMNRTLKRWAQRAGIAKNITLHTARHTCATTLLTKGADVYTVSKLLGHSSVKTTQIYAKIVDSKKIEAVSLLNNL